MKRFKFIITILLTVGIAFSFSQIKSFSTDKICLCESDQLNELDEVEKKENSFDSGKSVWLHYLQLKIPLCKQFKTVTLPINPVVNLILSKNFSKPIPHSPPSLLS